MSAVRRFFVLYTISMVQCLDHHSDESVLFEYISPNTCKNSCGYPYVDTSKFLETAPCPPLSNLSLICQHSYRLSCSEVAAILDRCIHKYDVSCDVVFSSLETCVCDLNMTCPAMNDTYINNCGWKESDFYCDSKGSIIVVTVPQTSPLNNTKVPVIESSSIENRVIDFSTSNQINPTIMERTTPFIGGSQSHQEATCDVTCILITSLGATTVCLITALILYKCHKRWQLRSKQDDSSPVSTLGYMDPKSKLQESDGSLSLSGSSIEKRKKGRQLIGPSVCDNHMGGIKVGRPCSGFYTHVIDRRNYEHFSSVDSSTGHLVWDGGFSTAIPLPKLSIDSDTNPRTISIPRPSLSTFKYDIPGNTLNTHGDFLGYDNPVFSESSQ